MIQYMVYVFASMQFHAYIDFGPEFAICKHAACSCVSITFRGSISHFLLDRCFQRGAFGMSCQFFILAMLEKSFSQVMSQLLVLQGCPDRWKESWSCWKATGNTWDLFFGGGFFVGELFMAPNKGLRKNVEADLPKPQVRLGKDH